MPPSISGGWGTSCSGSVTAWPPSPEGETPELGAQIWEQPEPQQPGGARTCLEVWGHQLQAALGVPSTSPQPSLSTCLCQQPPWCLGSTSSTAVSWAEELQSHRTPLAGQTPEQGGPCHWGQQELLWQSPGGIRDSPGMSPWMQVALGHVWDAAEGGEGWFGEGQTGPSGLVLPSPGSAVSSRAVCSTPVLKRKNKKAENPV